MLPPSSRQAKLLEHNVRFGDPECQSLMARCDSDVGEALLMASTGRLEQLDLKWNPQAAVTVVLAAKGYPGDYKKGTVIRGLEGVTGAKVGTEEGARMEAEQEGQIQSDSPWP